MTQFFPIETPSPNLSGFVGLIMAPRLTLGADPNVTGDLPMAARRSQALMNRRNTVGMRDP